MYMRVEVNISLEVIYTRLDEIRKSPADRQNARAARRRRENGAHG